MPFVTRSNREKITDDTISDMDHEHMRQAVHQMRETGIEKKTGGPFGAVIVLDGKIIASAGNSVLKDLDPTAHAEINAIRQACRQLGRFDLTGATLYTTGECCPMCYAAAYWARISKIYYAVPWQDYEDLFDDSRINEDISKPYAQRLLQPQHMPQEEAQQIWATFRAMPDRARY